MNSQLKSEIQNFKKAHYIYSYGKIIVYPVGLIKKGNKTYIPEPKFNILKLSNRDLIKYFKENGIEYKHHTHKNLYHNLISEKVTHEQKARRKKITEEEIKKFWNHINDNVPYIATEDFDYMTGEKINFSDLPPPPDNF